jgi:hypothetical protein
MNQGMAIHYDPRLVEEAVFHVQRDSFVRKELDEQRKRIYEVPDPDQRERQFLDLNRTWFNRLGLGNGVEGALSEQPLITAQVVNCFILCAIAVKEENAELFVAQDTENPPERTLRILLRPESLLNAVSLKTFLRHELFHIADMLDPAFGYEPTLPKAEGGPTYDTLITNRYRVLWDVTINGRMAHRGWCDGTVRAQHLEEFLCAFPMLDESSEEHFNRFFDATQPRHCELAAFAFDPRAAAGQLMNKAAPGTHCPLCRFPTHTFEPEPARLRAEVLDAIKEDFPNWRPSHGLCIQCADLYRARQLSTAAAKLLPGWKSCSRGD